MKIYSFVALSPLLSLLVLSFNAIVSNATLQVDLIDPSGLAYFRANNLTDPRGSTTAVKSLRSIATTALNNQRTYSIINSTRLPPNGDTHDYYSWAPYWWPDCSGVEGVTDQMTQCPYRQRDGQYNSDLSLLSDSMETGTMVRDVTALTLYYSLYGDERYAAKASQLLRVWFLNEATLMNPNVQYGQAIRGPGNWTGRSEGILDMRYFTLFPPIVEILSNSSSWNTQLTNGMKDWFSEFSSWLQNSEIGKEGRDASNNHGSFYYAQLVTYLHFIGKDDDARNAIDSFVSRQFQRHIAKDGDQPLESSRTRPYHYRCFNLIALTYLARLSQKINGQNVWEAKTNSGATIKTAIDFLVDRPIPSNENTVYCLVPIYSAREYYGDPDGRYASYLTQLLRKSNGDDLFWLTWEPFALNNVVVPTRMGGNRNGNDDVQDDYYDTGHRLLNNDWIIALLLGIIVISSVSG